MRGEGTRRSSPAGDHLGGAARIGALILTIVVFAVACNAAGDVTGDTFRPTRNGVLTVAATLPSPGFWDGDDPARIQGGFEWGLATALADRFDLRLEIVDVPFPQILSGELEGADLAIAEIEATDARSEFLTFSIPYFEIDLGVVVRSGESIRDLAAARSSDWAVMDGTRAGEFVEEVIGPRDPVRVVAREVDAAALVATGEVGAALLDLPTALVIADRDDHLTVTARFLTDGRYVIAMPRDTPNREAVDAALRAFERDGTLAELRETWLYPRFERLPSDVPVILTR